MACEKCWGDAYMAELADLSSGGQPEHYHRLLQERKDSPCTPEEQCGELHAMRNWKDGSRHCVCGAKVETNVDSSHTPVTLSGEGGAP